MSRVEVRAASLGRGAGIPLQARGKVRVLKRVVWHRQLDVPRDMVLEFTSVL